MSARRTLALAACLLGAALPAWAHAQLRDADPPVGGTVRAAPARVEIGFNEAVEPLFSTIEVTDAAGVRVDTGGVVRLADAKRLAVALVRLGPGSYRVVWRARSVDTHKTEGSYGFTVAP